MTMPPLLLAWALLFWGWEAGFLVAAMCGAVILELPRLVRWRWDFSATNMNRVWDLCGVLFLGAAIFAYATSDLVTSPAKCVTWMPMVFFPFVLATAFSAHDMVSLGTYFLMVRNKKSKSVSATPLGRYVPYWYLVVCIGSASIANARDIRFYLGVVLIGAWLLWQSRNRAASMIAWVIMFVCVSAAGFGGQFGLNQLQGYIENRASQFFKDLGNTDYDFSQTRTAIGAVGKLQQSARIVMRVQTAESHEPPLEYLRSASFDDYQTTGNRSSWSATEPKYGVAATSGFDTWDFPTASRLTDTATVTMFLPQGHGILPSPLGPTGLSGLFPGEVQTNRFGSIRVLNTYHLARYSVQYGELSTLDGPPTVNDLSIPDMERPAIEEVAEDLKLAGKPPAEILRRVESFFLGKFTYTSYLKGLPFDPLGRTTALSQFLLHSHAGHCEYFATATTLLLRQAHIPTRYAIGYAVPGEADSDRVHIVRALHAHAWVLAYVNGSWRNVDTTPGTWEKIEEANESAFQPINDFFAGLWYRFTYWRAYGERGALAKRLLWLTPVILLWFLWRIFNKKQSIRKQPTTSQTQRTLVYGLDSEFYLLEQHLTKAGVPRLPGESLHQWLRRLEAARQPNWSIPSLRAIIDLHYAYRFDPQGLPAKERRELKAGVETWLSAAMRQR